MKTLQEVIRYMRPMELSSARITQCYNLLPITHSSFTSTIECETVYDMNSIGSYIENLVEDIDKGYIVDAIKKTAFQFKHVIKKPRVIFYILVLDKILPPLKEE